MGCGASGAKPRDTALVEAGYPTASSSSGKLTKEQWLSIRSDALGVYGPCDDFSDGAWWWGHPNGGKATEEPEQCGSVFRLSTEVLPDYYRDVIRLKHCQSQMDYEAWTKPNARCPFFGGTTYLSHADVEDRLKQCPFLLAQGKVERRNELGYLQLDKDAFPLIGTIGLGASAELHQKVRPWVDYYVRRLPGRAGMLQEVHAFLKGRSEIDFGSDTYIWWYQVLWRRMLVLQLSWDEATKFHEFCQSWLVAGVLSFEGHSIAELMFGMDDVQKQQAEYRDMVKGKLEKDVPEGDRDLVAQALLELMAFAGGLSVPGTITSAVACLYREEFTPMAITEENVEAFVWEVTRLFPQVAGFPYWQDDHRHILYLCGALRDPDAFGAHAHQFTLKDLELYKKKHVGFAQPAMTGDADSRGCPGMDSALACIQAFVLAISTWAPEGERIDSIWQPENPIEPAVKPSWWKRFILKRLRGQDRSYIEELMDEQYTGQAEIAMLTPVDIEKMLHRVDHDRDHSPDVIKEMDYGIQLLFNMSKLLWVDFSDIKHIEAPVHPALGQFTDDNSTVIMGGVRLAHEDEQWAGFNVLQEMGLKVINRLNAMEGDDLPERLLVRTPQQRQESIAMVQLAFTKKSGDGTYLPLTKDPWDDLTSDAAQGLFATYGMAQIFLSSNTNDDRSELGEFMVASEVLSVIPVRDAFEGLGATAYFKRAGDGGLEITAIDWKYGNSLVKPGDQDWEHAKFIWRSSVGTYTTAVNHLAWTHWISSNGVAASLREALNSEHPVRRLLHAHYFQTAQINFSSMLTLYPENAFLHRMSCFTYEGLTAVFDHAEKAYKYQTWPQMYEASDLPVDVKDKMPMYQDGMPLWNALHEFHAKYVDLYYADDAAVQADAELKEYWKFKSAPPLARTMPQLTKKTLTEQITQAVFDVSAHHELVGSVCQYVTDPSGISLQVRKGMDMADMQQTIAACSLAASTGSPMPMLMDDWSFLLDLGSHVKVNKFGDVKILFDSLMTRLKEVSSEIQERNKTRPHQCSQFDPQFLECSVSL